MEPNHERSIILRTDSLIEKSLGDKDRIVAAMIDDTLSLARRESRPPNTRFKIGAYEWCKPDYRQILAWAKATGYSGKDSSLWLASAWSSFFFACARSPSTARRVSPADL